jgi:hypothetical protein
MRENMPDLPQGMELEGEGIPAASIFNELASL